MHPYANFTGAIRQTPRKLGVAFLHAYETDILELQLKESYDVVDKIFLVEKARSHFNNRVKHLFWEHLKWTPRFKRFQDKVVHIINDDKDVEINAVGRKVEHTKRKRC